MRKKDKEYPTPKFENLEAEYKYWQTHSPLDESYEGKVQKRKHKRSSFLSVRLTGEELSNLRQIAMQYHIAPSTYARQLIIQGMESQNKGTVTPDMLFHILGGFHAKIMSPEEYEKFMRPLNDIFKGYSEIQNSMVDSIVNTIVSMIVQAPGQDPLSKHTLKEVLERANR